MSASSDIPEILMGSNVSIYSVETIVNNTVTRINIPNDTRKSRKTYQKVQKEEMNKKLHEI